METQTETLDVPTVLGWIAEEMERGASERYRLAALASKAGATRMEERFFGSAQAHADLARAMREIAADIATAGRRL